MISTKRRAVSYWKNVFPDHNSYLLILVNEILLKCQQKFFNVIISMIFSKFQVITPQSPKVEVLA